jgi:hypothetical protein
MTRTIALARQLVATANQQSKICLAASASLGAVSMVGMALREISPAIADMRGLAWASVFYLVLAICEKLKSRAHETSK